MKNIPEQQTWFLLKQLKNKGISRHTKEKAESLMVQIKPRISYEDFSRITRARFHATHGEGAFEFNDVLDELIVKYVKKNQIMNKIHDGVSAIKNKN